MKNDIYNKSIYISMLLEMYGKLLTERQADIVDFYHNYFKKSIYRYLIY